MTPKNLAQLKRFLVAGSQVTALWYGWREARGIAQTPVVLTVAAVHWDAFEFEAAGHITGFGVDDSDPDNWKWGQVPQNTFSTFLPAKHYTFTPEGFTVKGDSGNVLATYAYGVQTA